VAKPICCVTKCASRDRQGQRAARWIFLLTMPFAAKELHIFISERLGLRFAKPSAIPSPRADQSRHLVTANRSSRGSSVRSAGVAFGFGGKSATKEVF
jgi:hypothetical protein